MKKVIRFVVIAVIVIVAFAAIGRWFSHRHSGSEEESNEGEKKGEKQAVAHVQVAKIERKTISENVISYGSVIAQPGKTHSVSVAFETRVQHILVAPGQFVTEDDPLVEIEPSPATQLQFQQARNASESAQMELDRTQERFNLKLATNQELGTAQKAARDAELQFASFQKLGVGTQARVQAGMSGVVDKVNAQAGQIVAVGGPLVEIVAEDEIEVKLGVETDSAPLLQAGQTIALFPVNDSAIGKVEGTVRLVARRVDPQTRLVDVYVALPPGTKLLLDGYIRGEITKSANALVVPRAALLPEDGGFELFTIKENHAVKHTVKTGLENDLEVEVTGDDLHEGDIAVTAGNYELEDGMSVEVQETK